MRLNFNLQDWKRLIPILFVFITGFSQAQEVRLNENIYWIRIFQDNPYKASKLIFHSVTDSTVLAITEYDLSLLQKKKPITPLVFSYKTIEKITLLKKRPFEQKVILGALGGGLGSALTYSALAYPFITEKLLIGSIVRGLAIGAIAGPIFGSVREPQLIERNKKKFERFERKYGKRGLIK